MAGLGNIQGQLTLKSFITEENHVALPFSLPIRFVPNHRIAHFSRRGRARTWRPQIHAERGDESARTGIEARVHSGMKTR
jgi:hypothetical protein